MTSQELTSPTGARPSVSADLLERFRRYHAKHGAWGPMHVVLDDDNLADDFVTHVIECAQRDDDREGEALARILLSMTKTQRSKIGALA